MLLTRNLIRFLISAGWLCIHQETALLAGLQIYSVIADAFSLSALSALFAEPSACGGGTLERAIY
jgi:hypothetical protein